MKRNEKFVSDITTLLCLVKVETVLHWQKAQLVVQELSTF